MNVKERQLVSARHAAAQSPRVSGGCGVVLYSSRPSSAHVLFVGGLGLGVADVQDLEEGGLEPAIVPGWQLVGDTVTLVVVV